ncbi:MAG: hypothetical protein EAZ42_12955 [Verrucomicrobia bacterium]|nr:MAG: hypothetical protein EAZ42_12955 [Verrucomicrobiota bacterium]
MLTLHPLYHDHAVIHAKRPRICGSATPHAKIRVTLAGAHAQTEANAAGDWQVTFPPLPAGGPHALEVEAGSESIKAQDILLGNTWLGSGQSNMEWTLAMTKDCEEAIASAHDPLLRFFTVHRSSNPDGPVSQLDGHWVLCTPRNAENFSSVGYFFGRRLTAELQQPVGMIISAWGGSSIRQWLPLDLLDKRKIYQEFIEERKQAIAAQPDPEETEAHEDPGISPHAKDWATSNFEDWDWTPRKVPGQWQDEGWDFNGAVWFRQKVSVPLNWIGEDLEIYLGVVDDYDQTFINGTLIGATGKETDSWWTTPRHYRIPAHLFTDRTLHIAVRVFDIWGGGGIMGKVSIHCPKYPEQPAVHTATTWLAKPEIELPSRFPGGPPPAPAALWNGMMHPLAGASLDGVLWYQGESDVDRSSLYPLMLADWIQSMRRHFDDPTLPCGIVQLANFHEPEHEPSEHPWAYLREAQRHAARSISHCGLVLAIDAGEADDIHPRDKKTVGERLALWALHDCYGKNAICHSGPACHSIWTENHGIRCHFVHAEGLRMRGNAMRGFDLLDSDGEWHHADQVQIAGDTVWARSSRVTEPLAVRYAWQANPATTLENLAGLPAIPFREFILAQP